MVDIKKPLDGVTSVLDQIIQKASRAEGAMATAGTAAEKLTSRATGTSAGQGRMSSKASADFAAAQNPEYYSIMQSFQNNGFDRTQSHNPNFALSAAGQLLKKQTDGTGAASYSQTNYGIGDFLKAQNTISGNLSKFYGNDTPNASKYGAKDIPRITNLSGTSADQLAGTLAKQSGSFARGDDTAQIISKVLNDYSTKIKTQQGEYKNALSNYSSSLSNPDEAKRLAATEALTRAMAQLDRTVNEATEVSKQSGNGSGAGGWLKNNALGIAGGAVTAYGAYKELSLAYDKANLGGNNQAYINQSALRGSQLSRQADYYDISSSDSLVRNRGDLLFGAANAPFLGQKGFATAQLNARKEEAARLDIVRQERNLGFFGRIGAGIVSGAGAGAAAGGILGLGVGAAPGAILGGVIGGIGGLIAGGSSYLQNEATAMDGGLFGVMNNTEAQRKAQTQSALNINGRAEQLRDANMASAQRLTRGIGGVMEMYSAQQQGALSVGGYAMTKDRLMGILNDAETPATRLGGFVPSYSHETLDKNAIRGAIAAVESRGDYNAVNASTGALGKYQIMPKGAFMNLAIAKGYVEKPSDFLNGAAGRTAQEDFFKNEMFPEYQRSARGLAKRVPAAAAMNPSVLTGLMQLGAGNIETYLKTGVDNTGGQIPGYISGLEKNLSKTGGFESGANAADDIAFNRDLKRQSFFAKNQISYTEFAGKYNSLVNVVGRGSAQNDLFQRSMAGINSGTDLTSLEKQTAGLISLERGGLGGFQENIGNIAALNKVNGSDNNYKALEGILGNAVAAGFDRSRMAQTFVRTTAELTQAVGATNTDYVGNQLSKQSNAFSLTGSANELSLNQASQAIQQYAQLTNGSGVVGIGKNLGALNAGATVRGGAGIVAGMNSVQAMSAIGELQSGSVTSIEADSLVRETMRTKGVSRQEAMKIAGDQLKASVQGGNSMLLAQMGLHGGSALAEQKAKLKTMKEGSKEFNDALANYRATAFSSGAAAGFGGLAGAEVGFSDLVASGIMTAKGAKGSLEQLKKNGEHLAIDPIKQQYQAFIDSATREATGKAKGLSVGEYIASASSGAQDLSFTSGGHKGQIIDSQRLAELTKRKAAGKSLNKEDQAYLENAEHDLKGEDRIERARSSAIAARETSTTQKVMVENFGELLLGLKEPAGVKDLNGSGLRK